MTATAGTDSSAPGRHAHSIARRASARALAFCIDVILLGIAPGLLRSIGPRAVASLAYFIYFVGCWSTAGRTVGMPAIVNLFTRVFGSAYGAPQPGRSTQRQYRG